MNILFFTHYFPPEGNAPASRVFENAKRWVKQGHRVTIVTGVPNVPDGVIYPGYVNRWRQWEETEGIRVLRVKTHIAPNKGFLRRILNYLSFMISSLQALRGTSDAEVVIGTSPQFFCAVAGLIVSRLKRLPFIMEVRDLWPESIIAVGAMKNRFVIFLLKRLERFLYHNADMIVAVTDSFRKIIADTGVAEDKIKVITNGVDIDQFIPKEKDDDILPELKNAFVVSYIGTLGMAHALERVLHVAESLKSYSDIKFLFVGSGADKEKLLRIKKDGNLENVIFLGRQPKGKIPDYYAVSDVCLVPLRNTPLFRTVIPSKMFEVMAMEKPLILSVDGEAREIFERSMAGIYAEPENESMLREAILSLYRNPDQARQMGKNGRLFVKRFYNRDVLAIRYLDIVRKMADVMN